MKATLLRGRLHAELGALEEAALGDVAAAISRGGAPKPYAHTDPNEDAALCARGTRGALVAVTDGHWGHRAAERVLECLLATHVETWTDGPARDAEAWRRALLAALVDLNDAVLALHDESERSRTTLALALARPAEDLLVSASVGDSLLFRVDAKGAVELPRARRLLFLGHSRARMSAFEKDACVAVDALDNPLAVVAATDGLSELGIGVSDPAAAVRTATAAACAHRRDTRAQDAARAIVEAALVAHRAQAAGDNVAAAVAWLER